MSSVFSGCAGLGLALLLSCGLSCEVAAQTSDPAPADPAAQRRELQRQLQAIQSQLDVLDAGDSPARPGPVEPVAAAPATTDTQLQTIEVIGHRDSASPLAQTATTVDREQFENTPAVNVGQILNLTPGVTVQQGNGPRDVSISVRGSNARQTFGVRNLKVFEDGFPVTQPDGLARTDLTDPHAYAAIDVMRGPSSAWYGNYATGGAIDFRTRRGREIDGVELGADFGSDGYFNDWIAAGGGDERFDYSVFGSAVRGDGDTEHTQYRTNTVNLLTSWQATPADRLTFKLINNDLDAALSIRLSRAQYELNPFQNGCADAAEARAGCASTSVPANGFNGARTSLSPEQAGLMRDDRRTIVGARWEHAIGADDELRTQLVLDNRDIEQPTGNTSFNGAYPSVNFSSDWTHRGSLLARAATTRVGGFVNVEDLNYKVFNLTGAGRSQLGGLTQNGDGEHLNAGLRLREELVLDARTRAVAGLGAEYTHLQAKQDNYGYPANAAPTITPLRADREFANVAPELGVQFAASEQWTLHARAAAGYGTPQVGNLFVLADGSNGNNTQLKAQRNLGFDLGADWTVARQLSASLTGFYEFFRNELVTQSAGANLPNYSFNAPRSEHRGIEAALDWQLLPQTLPVTRLRLSYLLDDQIYRDYDERLSAGSQSTLFDRRENDIPGVIPQSLTARLSHDQATGALAGLGGYVEYHWRDAAWLDNGNLIQAPSARLVNLGLHYGAAPGRGWLSRTSVYVSVLNLFDETYVASASNVADSIDPTTGAQNGEAVLRSSTGSIYAGARRSVFGGLRVRF